MSAIKTRMRVWKLEACTNEERVRGRWGHALAVTADEAMAFAKSTSGLLFNWIHEKNAAMLWPGAPGARVDWS